MCLGLCKNKILLNECLFERLSVGMDVGGVVTCDFCL